MNSSFLLVNIHEGRMLIIYFFVALAFSVCQIRTTCENLERCSACIQEPGCLWCSKPSTDRTHCRSKQNIITGWCRNDKLISPEQSLETTENRVLNDGKNSTPVQIQPQRVKMRMRKGEEFKLPFKYAKAANIPIDLYYIMDMSFSMKKYKNMLERLGHNLVNVMKELTNDFRLGFGTFVEKPVHPFSKLFRNKTKIPCSSRPTPECIVPYSFKNHLPLTSDHATFTTEVKNSMLSTNIDRPEGGFDALMQAIVCKDQIGWRHEARHLLVFSTDDDFHIAGDGKFVGAPEANDGRCHLENGLYIKSLTMDYPSVSHINYVAKENNINFIFAITKTSKSTMESYEQLQKNLENSAIGKLSLVSSNIVELIVDNYNKLTNSIRISDNSSSSIQITYQSPCQSPFQGVCSNLHIGEVANFTATIKPLECSTNNQHIIQIKPEGVGESLIVELEVDCDCFCEKTGPDFIVSSTGICSGQGNETCGVCTCAPGHFGDNCECDKDVSNDGKDNKGDDQCTPPNSTKVCNDLGTCRCGKCLCEERLGDQKIYGKYCECDNFSCNRVNGQICGGRDRGKCSCGKCECLPGWKGLDCGCLDGNRTCISPTGDGSVCSGHGVCSCGHCECRHDDYLYHGQFCEECLSCPGQRCHELLPCVECQVFQSGIYKANCSLHCNKFQAIAYNEFPDEENDAIKVCHVLDEEGCTIKFHYQYDDNKELLVSALIKKMCPEPVDIIAVVCYTVGSIIIAGIITLLIWKVYTELHDKREYQKFEKDKAAAKWAKDENPLFKRACSSFKNPIYGN